MPLCFLGSACFDFFSLISGIPVPLHSCNVIWTLRKKKKIKLPTLSELYTVDLWTTPVWLCRSTFTWIFFNKYVVSPPSPWVLYPQIQSTVDQKQHFWTKAGSLLMQRADCMHFYTILCNRLKQPQVLAFVRSPGTNSWGYRGMTVVKFRGNKKLYMDFRVHWGWRP